MGKEIRKEYLFQENSWKGVGKIFLSSFGFAESS
jgi:hypothetical protein